MMFSRAQSVADADLDLRKYLIRVAGSMGDLLGDALTGLYVAGSLATGTFRREWSSIDLIGVVARRLTGGERQALTHLFVRLADERPVPGDLRIVVFKESAVRAFDAAMPYEARYEPSLHDAIRRRRVDYEGQSSDGSLAQRTLAARERGVTLVGPPAGEMFAAVPWYAYVDSLHADFDRVRNAGVVPLDAILTGCRVLYGATVSSTTPPSKEEAAAWAIDSRACAQVSLLNDALQVRRGVKTTDDVVFSQTEVERFLNEVEARAQVAFARARENDDE